MNLHDIVIGIELYWLALFALPVLIGFSKYAQDARNFRGLSEGSLLFRLTAALGLAEWYHGGNTKYNPSLFGDLWHFFNSAVGWLWVFAGMCAFEFWLYPLIHYASQLVFVLLYHWIDVPAGNADHWTLSQALYRFFLPWRR